MSSDGGNANANDKVFDRGGVVLPPLCKSRLVRLGDRHGELVTGV